MKFKIARFKKISWKLTLMYAAIFSFVLIILSAGILYSIRYYMIQQAFDDVNNSSAITLENIKDTLHEQNVLTDPELLSEAGANSQINIVIADENGQVINASNIPGLSTNTDLNVARRIDVGDARLVVKNISIVNNGQVVGYLQVTKNMAAEYAFLKITVITIGIADILGLLLSVLAGFFVSKRMLRPIDKITKTANEISISDLNKRIEIKDNDDELARLAKTFNEMIERLKTSFDKQNAFVSDASHELRTPISVIRGYIDIIGRWGKDDKTVLDEAIKAIQNETHYMGDMVERLLFLARSDIGRLKINKERFDLHDLVNEMVIEYGIIYPEQVVISEIPENTIIFADRKLLKQALRALVDNSIKYNPGHEEIRMFSAINSKEIIISIKDMGIGIPRNKLNEIFERFYRIDSARERKTGGAGLGLSIVQTIVNAHGGSIKVESEPGIGTLASLVLPI